MAGWYNLVQADDLWQALTRLEESLDFMVIPYTVVGVNRTNIADVFPYDTVSELM